MPRSDSVRSLHERGIEQQPAAPEAPGDRRDQPVDVGGIEVHQQSLRRNEHAARHVDRVHPAVVERRARQHVPARRLRQQRAGDLDHLGQLDREPLDAAVVDAPELRLEALPQRHHRRAGVARGEARDRLVEAQRAQSLALREQRVRRPEPLGEREVDPVDQLDRHRIVQHRVVPACLGRAEVERPEQRLGNARELDHGPDDRPRTCRISGRTNQRIPITSQNAPE
jgi:hypothetical protein